MFSFLPAEQGIEASLGNSLVFSVSAEPPDGLQATWSVGGQTVGQELTYTYEATNVGTETLDVSVAAGERQRDHYWVVDVAGDPDLNPDAVPNINIQAGEAPVEMIVGWTRVNDSHFPIADYLVALSYEGIINASNWDQAQLMAVVPHEDGRFGYSAMFDEENDGLVPGGGAWVTVRARDETGQLSPIETNRYHEITTEWWIEGTVMTDSLRTALGGVIVRSLDPAFNDNTDGSGFFRLGPYRSIDAVQLFTNFVGHYDFVSRPLTHDLDANHDIVLIKRYGLDELCSEMDGDFLTYVRNITNNEEDPLDAEKSLLWRWEEYPLRVFLPDSVNAAGVDLDDVCRRATARWDSTLGSTLTDPYFVEVDSWAEADVVFDFKASPGAYGRVTLLDPEGNYSEGDFIPNKVKVALEPDVGAVFLEEVVLHELGHVLGLIRHSRCDAPDSEHLMLDAGASGALSRTDPIHIDEQRAVRCLRYLPQGVDMAGYSDQ